ncbi:unnamed protein product [Amoebophrya sp. A25]|nr:unnamed protein product [Amoebophrya sp. A25]|eukprot:GSA25T00024122001.1
MTSSIPAEDVARAGSRRRPLRPLAHCVFVSAALWSISSSLVLASDVAHDDHDRAAGAAPTPEDRERRSLFHSANLELESVFGDGCQTCGDAGQGSGSWDNNYVCSEQGGGVHQICYRNIKGAGFSEKTGQPAWSDERCENCNHCVCLGAWALFVAKGGRRELDNVAGTMGVAPEQAKSPDPLKAAVGGLASIPRSPEMQQRSRSSRVWRRILEESDAKFELLEQEGSTTSLSESGTRTKNIKQQRPRGISRALLSKKLPAGKLKCDAIPETALDYRYVGKWNTWNGHELPNQVVDGVEELVAQCIDQARSKKQRTHLTDKFCAMAVQTDSLSGRASYKELCTEGSTSVVSAGGGSSSSSASSSSAYSGGSSPSAGSRTFATPSSSAAITTPAEDDGDKNPAILPSFSPSVAAAAAAAGSSGARVSVGSS